MRNNKYRAFFTVAQVTTPKGLLVVQDYYPTKGNSKRWREYVIHLAGIIGGESLAFTTPEARDTWVKAQGMPAQQRFDF